MIRLARRLEALEVTTDTTACGRRRHRAVVTVAAAGTLMRRLARVLVRALRLGAAPVAMAFAALLNSHTIAADSFVIRTDSAARTANLLARVIAALTARATPNTAEELAVLARLLQRATRAIVVERLCNAASTFVVRLVRRRERTFVATSAHTAERLAVQLVTLLRRRNFETLRTANACTSTRIAHTRHRQTRTVSRVVALKEVTFSLVGDQLARETISLAATDTTGARCILLVNERKHSFSEEHTSAFVALARTGDSHRTAAVRQAAGAVVGTDVEKLVVLEAALFSVRSLLRCLRGRRALAGTRARRRIGRRIFVGTTNLKVTALNIVTLVNTVEEFGALLDREDLAITTLDTACTTACTRFISHSIAKIATVESLRALKLTVGDKVLQINAAQTTALGLRQRRLGVGGAAGILADLRVARLDCLCIQAARHTARLGGALGAESDKRVGAVVRIRARRTSATVSLAALCQTDVFRLAAAAITAVLTTAIVALFCRRLARQAAGDAAATTASSGVRRREGRQSLRGARMRVFGAGRRLGGRATVHAAVACVQNLAAIVIAIETTLARAATVFILVAAGAKLLAVR